MAQAESELPVNDRVVVESQDTVRIVRLNRPDKLNALDPDMFDALLETAEHRSVQASAEPSAGSPYVVGRHRHHARGLDVGLLGAVEVAERLVHRREGVQLLVSGRLEIDGQVVDEWQYEPTGLRDEGASYGLESLWLDPGTYQIRLDMMDDGETWQEVFIGRVTVRADEVTILSYNNQQNAFILTE